MTNIPILFVRYAPGAAGNFFISLLQTSNRVSCWNSTVESSKGTENFVAEYKKWFMSCFQTNLSDHLKYEPHHPYQLDFFSSKHLRGNDISQEQFIEKLTERNDQLFLDNIKRNKLTVMRLNKTIIPDFGKNNNVVNIVVDPPAKKWFYKIRYIKLFGRDNNGWISKENHPEFLAAKFKKILFQNQYCFAVSKFTFLRDFVVGESSILPFKRKEMLLHDLSNKTCNQLIVNLSCIFNKEQCINTMIYLFEAMNLGAPDLDLISWAFDHYYQTNVNPIEVN